MLAIWLASDWPIHDIAERYNYSIHMVQHLTFAMVAAPLLLLGTPAWLLRWVLSPPRPAARGAHARAVRARVARCSTSCSWSRTGRSMVNASLHSGSCTSRCTRVLFVSSLIVWLPIVSPLPEIPRLAPIMQMLYLFAWSVVPTVPASFLTFGSTPLYKYYETFRTCSA